MGLRSAKLRAMALLGAALNAFVPSNADHAFRRLSGGAFGFACLLVGTCGSASASQTIKPGEVPTGFSPQGWSQIQTALEAERYHVVNGKGGALTAFNPHQGFTTQFGKIGATLSNKHWRLPVSLQGYGSEGAVKSVAPASGPVVLGTRVEYRHGAVSEWYENRRSGLEQGFTLEHAPDGQASRDAAGRIALTLAVGGGFIAKPDKDGVVLSNAATHADIHYGGLSVIDAKGVHLPATLAVVDHKIVLAFAAKGAAFPVVIDPTFTQQQELVAGDAANSDDFGYSVALSGDTALVGAIGNNVYKGAAYVFTRTGSTWSPQQELVAGDAANGDYFGYSVALSGDTALVGANGKNSAQGAAYVFTRTSSTWSPQQKLVAGDAATGDNFGVSVALSGDTALVGAVGRNSFQGAAYVFTRTGSTWSPQTTLVAADGISGDYFGRSVALSGDTALVAAFKKNNGQGAAYVFTRGGSTWSPQQELVAGDAANLDYFGYSVALSGDTALLGARNKNGQGAAYVFTRGGSTWSPQQELVAGDAANGDTFGISVALSGDTALVGAEGKNSFQGAAYVFTRTGSAWSPQQALVAGDAANFDYFGYSVALSGDTALVAAYGKNNAQGAAYVFAPPVVAAAPVPTLQQWALILLSGALAVSGLWWTRQRSAFSA